MDKAGLPDQPSDAIDDIPVALREDPSTVAPKFRWKLPSLRLPLLLWGVIGLAIALIASFLISGAGQSVLEAVYPSATPSAQARTGVQRALARADGLTDGLVVLPDDLLGHFPYEEAPADTLRPITADGGLKLRQPAAAKFLEMVAAARAQGVSLVPLSGFRTLEDQEYLFFEVKAQRGIGATQRAEVSAPPGYSEHHTGYAVDLLDGTRPDVELSPSFENTPAFQWLQANAARYSFELSFPKDNTQGISYEPWHWRFVGDRHSLETFYRARQSGRVGNTPRSNRQEG